MKGYDKKSTDILNDIAALFCKSAFDHEILQKVYELGLSDGQLKQVNQQLEDAK